VHPLFGQGRQIVSPVVDPDGDPVWVAQSHDGALAGFIDRFDAPVVHPGQRVQIRRVGGLERRADEPGPGAFADYHSGRARH